MEIGKSIQVIYAGGTFGNTVRWLLDRFSQDTKFKDIDSPWNKDNRAHGISDADYNPKFIDPGHQRNEPGAPSPDPHANKIVVSYSKDDLAFIERCGFYRNPGWENEKDRYKNIISSADSGFVKETFGDSNTSKAIAKELTKINFHNPEKHKWWSAMNDNINDERNAKFNFHALWNEEMLASELTKISKQYNLNLQIEENVIGNVVNKIRSMDVIKTRDRAKQTLDAIIGKNNMICKDLDIIEQSFVESELEKVHDCLLFPYGTGWFQDTDQINDFISTFPKYLKHMNPRLPLYNNIANPFYLTGQIDKSK